MTRKGKFLPPSSYVIRAEQPSSGVPSKGAGWYGNELWLWRGKPTRLTKVAVRDGNHMKEVKPDGGSEE